MPIHSIGEMCEKFFEKYNTLGGSLNIWSRQINSRQGSNSMKWENDSSLMAWQRTSVRSTRRLHLDWSVNKNKQYLIKHFIYMSKIKIAICDKFTCDPVVRIMKVRTVVDEQVLNIGEHLIHYFYANVRNDAGVLNNISQTVLHEFRMPHLTCILNTDKKKKRNLCKLTSSSYAVYYFIQALHP